MHERPSVAAPPSETGTTAPLISSIADWLLDPSGLTPHGFCLLWEPWLVWTHVLANLGIGLAYFSIPVVLLRFVRRRRDLAFKPVFALFAAFILLCGAGHWADLLTLWWPLYRVEGAVKAATALVSVATAATTTGPGSIAADGIADAFLVAGVLAGVGALVALVLLPPARTFLPKLRLTPTPMLIH